MTEVGRDHIAYVRLNGVNLDQFRKDFSLSLPTALSLMNQTVQAIFGSFSFEDAMGVYEKVRATYPRPLKYVFFLPVSPARISAWMKQVEPAFFSDHRVQQLDADLNNLIDLIDNPDVVFFGRAACSAVLVSLMKTLKTHDAMHLMGAYRRMPAIKRLQGFMTKQSQFEAPLRVVFVSNEFREIVDPKPHWLDAYFVWPLWNFASACYYRTVYTVQSWARPT